MRLKQFFLIFPLLKNNYVQIFFVCVKNNLTIRSVFYYTMNFVKTFFKIDFFFSWKICIVSVGSFKVSLRFSENCRFSVQIILTKMFKFSNKEKTIFNDEIWFVWTMTHNERTVLGDEYYLSFQQAAWEWLPFSRSSCAWESTWWWNEHYYVNMRFF